MNTVTLEIVAYSEAMIAIQTIRHTVFQVEQCVDPDIDFDGQDDEATHLLAYADDKPIGTARIRYLSDSLAKIERVAVIPAYRGRGIGKQIMDCAIAFLNHQKIPEIKINAQVHAKTFYEKLGFQQYGEEFDEAGIPHIEMRIKNPVPFH
ncbi:GNAT family N-acetyltransferase [Oscillatoria sp. FACHB-1407]|uniref:GNAT family N-acetyltransferase n=1 Tax=Oscillatoria sp. FACHB-1407 TaxID=2692847 RepID=UPI00168327A7|nr:GNAT family N-acetyltransferase [Oscillatoria sp. FACHB-1407]MBD2464010.1 GNAT family N-acetyltransferase [Oscillatoria sp. FACHB-1407]